MRQDQRKIVEEMISVAPPGADRLDAETRDTLRDLTGLLLDSADTDEFERYKSIEARQLGTGDARAMLAEVYRGRRVLVTGGTGCIGSALLRELTAAEPADLFCVYAMGEEFEPIPGVVYLHVDIRDEAKIRSAIRSIEPDVIFHCAAQRSPWLAEREVRRTLETNVVGTRNVLRGARDVDVERFVHASTGKAMRYYTTDVYAASKKLAEWLVHDYAAEGRVAGLARFTHVVDNAVVIDKIDESISEPEGVMRVHDPDIHFYAQSAVESAQLLMLAGLHADTGLHALAIRELGDPVCLADLVLGRMLAAAPAQSPVTYFSGYDAGYEHGNPPGLYDPANASDFSPLINAVEAQTASPLAEVPEVDQFRLSLPDDRARADHVATRMSRVCERGTPMDMRAELVRDASAQAEVAFRECPESLFSRLNRIAERSGMRLPTTRLPRGRTAA